METYRTRYKRACECIIILHVICLFAHDAMDKSTTLVSNAISQWCNDFVCACPNIIVRRIWSGLSCDYRIGILSWESGHILLAACTNLYMRTENIVYFRLELDFSTTSATHISKWCDYWLGSGVRIVIMSVSVGCVIEGEADWVV